MAGDTIDNIIIGITTIRIAGTGVIITAGETTIDITPGTIAGIPTETVVLTGKTERE